MVNFGDTYDIAELQARWPHIDWREPIAVTWPLRQRFACRVCIANNGLNRDSPWQWPTKAEAIDHIAREHP